MNWRTEVNIKDNIDFFTYKSATLSMGSCFSSEVGGRLKDLGFNIEVNPFGVVFNPVSIFQQLQNSLNGQIRDDLILNRNEQFYHFGSHSEISGEDQYDLMDKLKSAQEKVRNKIMNGTHLFLTFGTAWGYRLNEEGVIVANCHKMPSDMFTKELIDLEKLKRLSESLFKQIFDINPNLKVLVTVSPVRHKRDGLHENNVSKGLLQLYVHHLMKQFKQITYFPSYELVIDELRDYRFYKEDLLHPSEQAIDFVIEKFESHFMNEQTRVQTEVQRQLQKAKNHRFMNASEEEQQKHQEHIQSLEKKLAKFNP